MPRSDRFESHSENINLNYCYCFNRCPKNIFKIIYYYFFINLITANNAFGKGSKVPR